MKRKILKYGAPIKALSPYNYFYKDKVSLYKRSSSQTFFEFIKDVSFKYNNLSPSEKQQYIDLANKDKLRYEEDMKQFKNTSNYKHYLKSLNSKSKSNNKTNSSKKTESKKTESKIPETKRKIENKPLLNESKENSNGSEIPIFTTEFLEHNQQREEHLRNIKKQANQLEEQTALLSKHLDNLNNATEQSNKVITKFQDDIEILGKINTILDHGLLQCFSKFKPTNSKQANLQISKSNIPLFVSNLKEVLYNNPDTELLSKLKDKMKSFPQLVLSDLKKI